jgi:hypothetical protein
MVNLKSFFLSLILLVPFITFSQDECGTDEMIRRNPFLQQLYTERVACAPEVDLDTAQVLTIPVVFHVIHLGEPLGVETNISDEQILSCIENLNHRFRGDVESLAALTDQYDEYELSLVKDSKIEFCLAARDPNNEPTDGIMRYDGSDLTYTNNAGSQPVFESYAEDGISNDPGTAPGLTGIPHTYLKQLYHWPVDKYFNCYVVTEINGNNGNNGIQGFSYLGSSGTGINGYIYGPVCLYNVTGITGTLKSGRELNATWAHEIGHAFNLFHTFSNGFTTSDCDSETNPCTQGDQVPDTPPTTSNQGCSPEFASCPDAMLQNYMDYTGEQCKTAFTQGQIERMREEVWTGLPYLVSTDNVSCQSPTSKDVGITSITVPSDWCLETIDFNVKINNFGGEPAEGVTLLVNNTQYNVPTIEPSGFVLIPINDFVLGDGIIEAEVLYDLDEFLGNNTITQVVEVIEQNWVEVHISPDVWSNEIDWEIIDESGEVVMYDGNWSTFQQDSIFVKSSCLPDGCYTFIITDTNGDGMCAFDFNNDGVCDADYNVFINIIVNENIIFDLSQLDELDYGSILEVDFCTLYCPPVECQGDFDGDGTVGIQDLLTFLSTPPGQLIECSEFDFNNDLQIDLNDILDLLEVYGTVCGSEQTIVNSPPEWVFDLINQTYGEVSNITEIKDPNCIEIIYKEFYDIMGRKTNQDATLTPGIYIIVEYYSNGDIITRKIYLHGNE